jgi:2-C-methyl-D-erythritol 2,4-cyclodiphosphate synthase
VTGERTSGRPDRRVEGDVAEPIPSPSRPAHLPRVGIGLDVHGFATGRPLILGGVTIPHDAGLAGHSDGDALIHAIIDALLGAAARGDIGQWFPSSDSRWSGADSLHLLQTVVDALAADGWEIGNVDATVIAQQPRIGPHVEAMRERLAGTLGLPLDAVSVKATTTDHLGALGRAEGIAAQAVALLVRR